MSDTFYVISGSNKHFDTYEEALETATSVVSSRATGHIVVYESVVRVEKALPPIVVTHLR